MWEKVDWLVLETRVCAEERNKCYRVTKEYEFGELFVRISFGR